MKYERASSACICDDDVKGAWVPESPRVYPHVMFKPRPSPFIAEFAHPTHNYLLRVRVKITDRINGEGLGSEANYRLQVLVHCKNGRVVFTTVWLYQFHLWDPHCSNIIIHGTQSSSLWRGVHAFTISSHIL